MVYDILKIRFDNQKGRKTLEKFLADPEIIISRCYVSEHRMKTDTLDFGFEFCIWLTPEQKAKYHKESSEFRDDNYDYDEVPADLIELQESLRMDIKRLCELSDELKEIAERYERP